ncbi:MAG: hypothetical protein HY748_18235 [Elusimicrobia bacterium]|nr:hypothetical protein [Elusimicrobiota bacterium]
MTAWYSLFWSDADMACWNKAHAIKAFQKGLEAGPSDDTKRELEDELARLKN